MTSLHIVPISRDQEDDYRAEARQDMFSVLRSAFKKRSTENGVRAKDLAEALGKDKGYVSRVLKGTSGTIDFETLRVFMEGLGFYLPLKAVPYEDLKAEKSNYDARPEDITIYGIEHGEELRSKKLIVRIINAPDSGDTNKNSSSIVTKTPIKLRKSEVTPNG